MAALELLTADSVHPDAGRLAALGAAISATLDPLIRPGRPIALLDAPVSPNVGDSAIWLGTMAYLRRRGIRPCYTCGSETLSIPMLAKRVGNGTILLSGGGNLGDLYAPHQRLREQVLSAFPRNRVIQLPQSIHFQTPAGLERAKRAFDGHSKFTLVVRDRVSLAIAREEFRASAVLCPDMAFALGPLSRPETSDQEIVWLARADREAVERGAPPKGSEGARVDWLKERRTPLLRVHRLLHRNLRDHPSRRWLQDVLSSTYEAAARERLARGRRLLGSGRFVITDRLHGHVIALLLGIPHAVLDNSYGKVRAVYDAWTKGSPLATWCESESEALAVARAYGARETVAGPAA